MQWKMACEKVMKYMWNGQREIGQGHANKTTQMQTDRTVIILHVDHFLFELTGLDYSVYMVKLIPQSYVSHSNIPEPTRTNANGSNLKPVVPI